MKAATVLASRLAIVFFVVTGSTSSVVFAEWGYFLPRPIDNDLFVEAVSSYEEDNLDGVAGPVGWNDTFVKEKITLASTGFSYDPRFLLYQVSLTGGLSQELYERSNVDLREWTHGSGPEYNVKLHFLPEHSYNLRVFAARHEPLYKEQAATRHDRFQTIRGAELRYRRRPLFLETRYTDESIGSEAHTSDVSNFNAEAQYFKQFQGEKDVSFVFSYNPSKFSDTTGLEGDSTQYTASNLVDLRRLRLSSSFSAYKEDQRSPTSGGYGSDQIALYEQLSTYLPRSLRADASYRFQDSDNTLSSVSPGFDQTLSSTSSDFQFDLIHRLYQSLETTYTFLRGSRTSFGGESTTVSHSLSLEYNKSIRPGRVLAGLDLSRVSSRGSGEGTDVVNEPHSAIPVPTGTFILNQENVDEQSILVFLKSPLAPFETVLLQRGAHYTVTAVAERNTFEIRVFSLPPRFAPSGTYDFLVSYGLVGGGYELRPDTFAGTLSVELLDRLLTPYVSYSGVRPDVVSGVFPGNATDSTTFTAGLLVYGGALRARGEYQRLDWEISPYESRRAEMQFVGSLTPTVRTYATASYLNKERGLGASSPFALPFTEVTMTVSGHVEKQVNALGLSFSAGGSYSELQGLVDSNTYSVNALLNWTVGKLKLGAGADAYRSENKGSTASAMKRDHMLVFVNVRRQLF